MKTLTWIAVACTTVFLSGCLPSVYPFYTEKDVISDPRLAGEWQEKEESDQPECWAFEDAGDKTYTLTITDNEGKTGTFDARLLKLEQELFLDIVPSECDFASSQVDIVAAAVFPGHLLLHVRQLEPELQLAFMDFEWLQKHLENHPKSLAHHKEDDRILLTATTGDLQKFVMTHLKEGNLFDEYGDLVRKTNATPTEAKTGE